MLVVLSQSRQDTGEFAHSHVQHKQMSLPLHVALDDDYRISAVLL